MLSEALADSTGLGRPRLASAIGYYGDRDDELLTEESPPGEGFLAEVVRRWEESASPAAEAGLRVVEPALRDRAEPGRRGARRCCRRFASVSEGSSEAAGST